MFVVINIRRHGRVMVIPFVSCDLSVSVFIAKGAEELKEHVVLSHLSRLNLRVEGSVIDGLQVCGSYNSVSIFVELKVGLVNDCLSVSIRSSSNSLQELVKVNIAVFVSV